MNASSLGAAVGVAKQGGDMRLIVALLLLTVTVPAWSEWLKYAEDKEVVIYYDPATIKKTGNLRRVWEIEDLKKRPTDGESSSHMMFEYDCKEKRYRGLSFSTHSEPMASGKTLLSHDKPSTWREVVPNSDRATMLNIVCKQPRQRLADVKHYERTDPVPPWVWRKARN